MITKHKARIAALQISITFIEREMAFTLPVHEDGHLATFEEDAKVRVELEKIIEGLRIKLDRLLAAQ